MIRWFYAKILYGDLILLYKIKVRWLSLCILLGSGVFIVSSLYAAYRLDSEKYTDTVYQQLQKNPVLPFQKKSLEVVPYAPVESYYSQDGHYFAEFPQTFFGTIKITFSEPLQQDTDIIVVLGEKRHGDRVWQKADGDINCGDYIGRYTRQVHIVQGQDSLVIEGPKRGLPLGDELPNGIVGVTPFRYCEIRASDGILPSFTVQQMAVSYPFDDTASDFCSNDAVLNDVWCVSKHTIKATTYAGIFVDGNRERRPYEADAYINQLGYDSVVYDSDLSRRTLRYLLQNPTWPTEWTMHLVLMAYEDYMYTGDKAFLREIYSQLKDRTLIALEREDGLISVQRQEPELLQRLGLKVPMHDIIDWPECERDGYASVAVEKIDFLKKTKDYYLLLFRSRLAAFAGLSYAADKYAEDAQNTAGARYNIIPVNTVTNAFHYRCLVVMKDLAKALAENDDELFYAVHAEQVRNSIQQEFFDYTNGHFVDGEGTKHASLHANMFPLAFGLVPEGYQDAVTEYIKSRGMACSVYGAQYLLEGLYASGEGEYATGLLCSTENRSWAHMIYDDQSDLTMEAWNNDVKPNQDWNHAWGSVPVNIISRYLFGIRPVTPGFQRAVFQPQLIGVLENASILVPTQYGGISVQYRQLSDDKYSFQIDIPPGVTMDMSLPGIFDYDVEHVFLDQKEQPIGREKTGFLLEGMEAGRHEIIIVLQ